MRPPEARADETATIGTQAASRDLEDLVGRASAALHLQCNAAHRELAQTRKLLSDATRNLLDCFQEAHRGLVSADSVQPEPVARSLLAATQHMQFSDLVGQLLATTEQRVDALTRVSQRLHNLVERMSAVRSGAQPAELAGEQRAFLEALAALESCGDSRVRQSDMKAGDIDLF
jgi:hypothetical protein